MAFLTHDDHILLMIDQDGGQFSLADLCRLREIGIRTTLRYVLWKDIETSPGHCNWGPLEEMLELDECAGLKTLLMTYDLAPAFFPDDYYMQWPGGGRYGRSFYQNMLAPWVPAAWQAHLDFLSTCCLRYASERVLLARGTCHGGECMFPDHTPVAFPPGFDMRATVLRMMHEEQAIFAAQTHKELYTQLHPAFRGVEWSGNGYMEDLYQSLHDDFPDHRHVGITYTMFAPVGGLELIPGHIKKYGMTMYCGSEYCEGARKNTERAIELGLRGFVTGPLHGLTRHRVLEPWMLDALGESIRKWADVYR